MLQQQLQVTTSPILAIRKWIETAELFAVIDGCCSPGVAECAASLGESGAASLFQGRSQAELGSLAPYVFAVDGRVFEWVVQRLWSLPWGFFMRANSSLADLRHHLRQFLLVEAADGGELYFRFYDPRVFTRFLPSCSSEQLDQVFGSIRCFGLTDLETYGIQLFHRGMEQETVVESKDARVRFHRPSRASQVIPTTENR